MFPQELLLLLICFVLLSLFCALFHSVSVCINLILKFTEYNEDVEMKWTGNENVTENSFDSAPQEILTLC